MIISMDDRRKKSYEELERDYTESEFSLKQLRIKLNQTIGDLDYQKKRVKELQERLDWQNGVISRKNNEFSATHKVTLIASRNLIERVDKFTKKERREDGLTPLHKPELTKLNGLSDNQNGRLLKDLADSGIIERKLEVTPEGHKRLFIALPDEVLENTANIKLKAVTNHGGKPGRSCENCGGKKFVKTERLVCAGCGVEHSYKKTVIDETGAVSALDIPTDAADYPPTFMETISCEIEAAQKEATQDNIIPFEHKQELLSAGKDAYVQQDDNNNGHIAQIEEFEDIEHNTEPTDEEWKYMMERFEQSLHRKGK